MSNELIAKVTALPLEQIKALKKGRYALITPYAGLFF